MGTRAVWNVSTENSSLEFFDVDVFIEFCLHNVAQIEGFSGLMQLDGVQQVLFGRRLNNRHSIGVSENVELPAQWLSVLFVRDVKCSPDFVNGSVGGLKSKNLFVVTNRMGA